ncbi:hypothetical protein M1N57_01710 [Dehalococcoidales bacterium]|nr:hypothetical protein [Dehalococcoidales bacterium]
MQFNDLLTSLGTGSPKRLNTPTSNIYHQRLWLLPFCYKYLTTIDKQAKALTRNILASTFHHFSWSGLFNAKLLKELQLLRRGLGEQRLGSLQFLTLLSLGKKRGSSQ